MMLSGSRTYIANAAVAAYFVADQLDNLSDAIGGLR